MTIRKSITFTDNHNEWLKTQIESGQYTSESEIIRDLIRERQQTEFQHRKETPEEIEAIRKILAEAEASEFSERTFEEIREEARAKLMHQ